MRMQYENTMSASAYSLVVNHETNYTGVVQLRYNYRLYPTPGQRQALARAFGCARVVFNGGLRTRQDGHAAGLPYITDAELSARLAAAKASPDRAWLSEVSAVVPQQSLADLNAAYRNFFASATGKRKGPKVAPPRFRSRKDRRQAIRFTRNEVYHHHRREAAAPEDRRRACALVPRPAVRAIIGHRDHGRSGPVLRKLRRGNR